jgi:hypothetical protein
MDLFDKILEFSAETILYVIDEGDNYEDDLRYIKFNFFDEVTPSGIPFWEELSCQEKIDSIRYVLENPNDEDFGHSQCCKPVHQATAYFLFAFFETMDLTEELFDDLDFLWIKRLENA